MKRKSLYFATLFSGLLLLSACSTPRPVIFEADHFDGRAVGEGRTAYLLPMSVDLTETVQEFVTIFEGTPAKGEAFLLHCLDEFLSGNEIAHDLNVGGRPRYGTRLTNLGGIPDPPDFGSIFVTETDKYGITQLEVTDPEGLAATLKKAGFDHLVLLHGLRVTRQDEDPTVGPVESAIMGGDDSKFATLFGQVIIWERSTQSIVWNGYVNGKHSLYRNFTKNTVKGMASEFSMDLATVLR